MSEDWKVQFSRNKGGVMVNVRGESVDEVWPEYVKALDLVDGEPIKKEGTVADYEPFYSDGTEPYKKRDGSTGFRIPKGSVPEKCPLNACKGNMELEHGQWGDYFQCSDCGQIVNVKKEKK